jgi:GT2 family glycosyltransferase
MPTSPIISVVIPNWNGWTHLQGCLAALQAQTYRDFEIIVVDNGSVDESVVHVQAHFPEVRLVCLAENRGFAEGCNAGIAVAQGDFIALLNNDTLADPEWLAALIQASQVHPEYAMWACRVVLADQPQVLDSAGDGLSVSAAPFKRGHLEPAADYSVGQEVFGPSGSAGLYRKTLLDTLGGLDADFFLIHEDVDLAWRARLTGARCWYVPDAIVEHKVNATLGYLSWTYVFYGHRNLEYVFVKNMPVSLLLRCLPAHILFNLLAWGHFILHGYGLTFLQAKAAAVWNLRVLWRKRRSVQAQRQITSAHLLGLMQQRWIGAKLRAATYDWLRKKHKKCTKTAG